MHVSQVMTTEVVTTGPEASCLDICTLLYGYRISALPVVGQNGCLLGIVSADDVLSRSDASTAAELMTQPVVTVTEDTEIREVARILTMNRIKRVPVTRDGLLVGIASRSDLLRAWLRPDADIRTEIIERILPAPLVPYLPDLEVDVRRGVVTLSGRVRDRSTVHLIQGAVGRVPGVVRVVNLLVFDEDDLAIADMLTS